MSWRCSGTISPIEYRGEWSYWYRKKKSSRSFAVQMLAALPKTRKMSFSSGLMKRVSVDLGARSSVAASSRCTRGMGKREAWKYHFMVHQFVSNTETALSALEARKQKGSMKEVFAERDKGAPPPAS